MIGADDLGPGAQTTQANASQKGWGVLRSRKFFSLGPTCPPCTFFRRFPKGL